MRPLATCCSHRAMSSRPWRAASSPRTADCTTASPDALPDAREVVGLHRAILESSRGASAIRDLGALESALAQPRRITSPMTQSTRTSALEVASFVSNSLHHRGRRARHTLLRMNFGRADRYGAGNALIVWEAFQVRRPNLRCRSVHADHDRRSRLRRGHGRAPPGALISVLARILVRLKPDTTSGRSSCLHGRAGRPPPPNRYGAQFANLINSGTVLDRGS